MGFIKEFKEFTLRGNVIDLAVGIIIGAAFGKIVSSLVNDIIMPPIGLLVGNVDFSDLKVILKEKQVSAAGTLVAEGVSLNYGNFIQTVVDFAIVAFCIFILIKAMNRIKKKEEKSPPIPLPSNQEKILIEIRDLLKERRVP